MKQKGFTLIEILVVLPMAAVMLVAIVGAIFLIMRGTIDIKSEMVAQADVENAVHWLTRDIIMGQSINILEGEPPVNTVNLTWIDYTGGIGNELSHYVVYTHSGTELLREYDSADNTTIVARNLSDVWFTLIDDLVTITLTSTPEKASRSTVTRTYVIEMRARGE